MHICIGNLTIIGSDNGLSPGRRQAIIWTNAGMLLFKPIATNFSEILIKIITFSFKTMHSKVSSGKQRPSCLGLNVLRRCLNQMWVHRQVKATKPNWSFVNSYSGNGLVLLGNKPLPESVLTNISNAIWHHHTTMCECDICIMVLHWTKSNWSMQ